MVKRALHNKLLMTGFVVLVGVVLVTAFAPWIAPYSPTKMDYNNLESSPNLAHPFGTDDMGRDILSRVIHGAKYTLLIAAGIVLIESSIGILLGLAAGYFGGIVDSLVMRLVDIALSFPINALGLVLAITLGGGGFVNVMIAIGIIGWRTFARLVRGEVLSIKEEDYIEAARAYGASDLRLMFIHTLPNLLAVVIINATLQIPRAIITAAALSFLGVGAQPPTPEWGLMISEGREYLRSAWWIATIPGMMMMITVLAFNFLGDGLRDVLDPRLRNT